MASLQKQKTSKGKDGGGGQIGDIMLRGAMGGQ